MREYKWLRKRVWENLHDFVLLENLIGHVVSLVRAPVHTASASKKRVRLRKTVAFLHFKHTAVNFIQCQLIELTFQVSNEYLLIMQKCAHCELKSSDVHAVGNIWIPFEILYTININIWDHGSNKAFGWMHRAKNISWWQNVTQLYAMRMTNCTVQNAFENKNIE